MSFEGGVGPSVESPTLFFFLSRAHGYERTWNSKVGHVGKVTLEHLTNNNEMRRGG